MAHLCLGATGISGALSDVAIEQFCNDVAGEYLLPTGELDTIQLKAGQSLEQSIAIISEFAEARNLSRSMVAYKLFRKGFISWESWQAYDKKLREMWMQERSKSKDMAKSSESGPNYYTVRRHRLGRAILEFASRNVSSGALSPVKAAKVLGVKPRSVYPLLINIPHSGLNKVARGDV
jgi:Zn-dependent peptidase ImmA (M78 family)